MKKVLVVVAVFAALVFIAFAMGLGLVRSAEKRADLALQRSPATPEPGRLAKRNTSAERVEILARPLAIEMRPRAALLSGPVEFEPGLMRSMMEWLRVQEEGTADAIDAAPLEVKHWLAEHTDALDAVANALVDGDVPRWTIHGGLPPEDAVIPNLMGHLHLLRVLNVATLDRESRGDHAGAWKLQHAAWRLTRGLLDRPEMISTLVGIAGVKMSAPVQRKLEAPVPLWRGEIAQRPFTKEMVDTARRELAEVARRMRESSVVDPIADGGAYHDIVAEVIASPVIRWSVAERLRAAFEQLNAVRTEDPCVAIRQPVGAMIEKNTPPTARHFGRTFIPNLTSAIGRAALAEIAVEGTSKVLALKTARATSPNGAWPAPDATIGQSRCHGEQWVYTVDPEDGMSLRFSGDVPNPANFQGPKITMEYVAQ